MKTYIDLMIVYSQIVVFHRSGKTRELPWTDDHVAQGFTWSPGDVAFGTPSHDGFGRIEVYEDEGDAEEPHSLYEIQVPFRVSSEQLMIGSIVSPKIVEISVNTYNLKFKVFAGYEIDGRLFGLVAKLIFLKSVDPCFKIFKTGQDVTSKRILRDGSEY